GINTYAYVGGDPISSSDPLGLCDIKIRCGTVVRSGLAVGTHCAVIAPNGQEFGLTGGNASGGAGGTAKPYVRPRAPLGPSQQDYPVSCQCQSCQDVQNCIQNVNNWIT